MRGSRGQAMKLGSLKGLPRRTLLVVGRDLAADGRPGISPTMQHALENWRVHGRLRHAFASLESGNETRHAFDFQDAPRRAGWLTASARYEWLDGSAYPRTSSACGRARNDVVPRASSAIPYVPGRGPAT